MLTKRGKHLGQDIPMCGVPIHRADDYLQRLIKRGYRVAVCEQLEDPAEARKRGAKAVVRRDVVRLVTPGTLTEEALLDARARNYLTALFRAPGSPEAPALSLETTLALASSTSRPANLKSAKSAVTISRANSYAWRRARSSRRTPFSQTSNSKHGLRAQARLQLRCPRHRSTASRATAT